MIQSHVSGMVTMVMPMCLPTETLREACDCVGHPTVVALCSEMLCGHTSLGCKLA